MPLLNRDGPYLQRLAHSIELSLLLLTHLERAMQGYSSAHRLQAQPLCPGSLEAAGTKGREVYSGLELT